MRILCIVDDVPRPETSGYKIRLANIVRALADVGDVDLFMRVPPGFEVSDDLVPTGSSLSRVTWVHGDAPRSTIGVLLRWPFSRLPRTLIRMRSDRARAALQAWVEGPYDVVWMGHAHSHAWFRDLVSGPVIVDLDNLEDQHIRHHREVRRADSRRGSRDRIRSGARQRVASLFDRVDERRWRRLQHQIAADAEAVLLCSELDRVRMGVPNAKVLANGYDLPSTAGERPERPTRAASPTFLLVGLLTYEPNVDAAWFFADEVLPALRAAVPDARLRLVGHHDWQVQALADRPGVTLCGRVDDLAAELLGADAAVLPVRFGGGTRIKALEAFAWRLPLVSTTVGVEGIPAVPDVHFLAADTPEAFVEACRRLTVDRELGRRLADAGHALWRQQFRWPDLRASLGELVLEVAGDRHLEAERR